MKIICVARNYAAHAAEMNHDIPDQPIFFLKPATALKRKNLPFFLPDFSREIHYETELVFRICRHGKNIDARYALRYVDRLTVGIDFTARDIQTQLKAKGWPWEIAKAFDGSACVGDWQPIDLFPNLHNITFRLDQNGRCVQQGNSAQMIFPVPELIARASRYFLLLEGDLLFTGTPQGVGPVFANDILTGFINDQHVLTVRVK